jgi:hypothetical protein
MKSAATAASSEDSARYPSLLDLQDEGQETGKRGDRRCWNVVSWREKKRQDGT